MIPYPCSCHDLCHCPIEQERISRNTGSKFGRLPFASVCCRHWSNVGLLSNDQYHIESYINNTRDGGEEQEEDTLATFNVVKWRVSGDVLHKSSIRTQHAAIYDSNQDKELIETVFLRNANHPPTWNSSTDSLWKALPAKHKEGHDLDANPNPSRQQW